MLARTMSLMSPLAASTLEDWRPRAALFAASATATLFCGLRECRPWARTGHAATRHAFFKVCARVSTCSAHVLRKVWVCILLKWAINMKHRTSEIDRELGKVCKRRYAVRPHLCQRLYEVLSAQDGASRCRLPECQVALCCASWGSLRRWVARMATVTGLRAILTILPGHGSSHQ